MKNMQNRIARNRTSPANEDILRQNYLKLNPKAGKCDNMDISCVITKDGEKGHGLLSENINRSHDKEYHRVKDFIPDSKLK